jgi:ketosteroid isomerase-like protein
MSRIDPLELVRAFVDRINQHDVSGLCNLMSDDHVFVDSLGTRVTGREEMRKAWIGYFFLIPDFHISITETMVQGNTVGMFGSAHGTCSVDGKLHEQNRWEMPASWKAIVSGDKVSCWQVYADNEPVRQIMASQK